MVTRADRPRPGLLACDQDTGHLSCASGNDRCLHLHRFEDQQPIAGCDRLADLDVNFDHHATHPGHFVAGTGGGRGLLLRRGRRRRALVALPAAATAAGARSR
jgi:hypothetical protein